MAEAALSGLLHVLSWPTIGYMLVGIVAAGIAGTLPGIGGPTTLILLLPFAFQSNDPFHAAAMLLGAHAVLNTFSSITAILLNVPGENAAQAILMDGYPMARKGEAGRALGASFAASAIGGVFGAVCLAAAIPMVTPLIRVFGSPELFMLAVWGLTMVGILSGSSPLRGLSMAAFGLLLATVGLDPQRGYPRFTFGEAYFWDGLPLVALATGLFAAPEAIDLINKRALFARASAEANVKVENVATGVRDAVHHWKLVLRNSALGAWLGVIPGVGGIIIDWIAYGHTVQSARDREQFGKGDVRGVIGPDAANNSKEGGHLIPTIAFGVPASASMAILLGAFVGLGISPGRDMLTTNLNLTFGLVWILVISNLIAAGVMLFLARYLAKITTVSPAALATLIIIFTIVGAFMARRHVLDLVALLVFSVVGYLMKVHGWPRPPVILGFVLGDLLERYLFISFQTFGPGWVLRPAVLVLLGVILVSLFAVPSRMSSAGQAVPAGKEGTT